MIWHLTSFNAKGIISRSFKKPLFHLLLILMPLNHWNLFSMRLLITSFIKPLFQHVLMNAGNVMSQIISVKTAQSFKSTNQLKLKRLSSSLTISSPVKILRLNISVAVMMMVSQKITWIFQKTLMFYKKHYEIQSII